MTTRNNKVSNPAVSQSVTAEEIVKLAYSMSVGHHRLTEMEQALKDHLLNVVRERQITVETLFENKDALNPELELLEPHFEQALSLMQSQGRRINYGSTSLRLIESDARPIILIEVDGRVHYANPAAKTLLAVTEKQTIDDAIMEYGQSKILNNRLKDLSECDPQKIIGIFDFIGSYSNQNIKFALTKDYTAAGQMVGRLSAIQVGWTPDMANHFSATFKLTPAELEITRAIVMGITLSQLAKNRGRAVGTVRQQTKKLLKKLDLKSQSELVSLYSGFSKYNLSEDTRQEDKQDCDNLNLLLRPKGRVLDYYIYGPEKGRPVLFFPALLGGTTLTDEMKQALYKHNIKLIMVWRPFLSKCQPPCPPTLEVFEYYADDITALLDKLGHKSCSIIGHMTSAVYAFAMTAYLPERINSIANINGALPVLDTKLVKYLNRDEIIRQFLVRRFPKISRMLNHSILAKIEAGYDQESMSVYFANSPLDQEICERDNIKYAFRKSFNDTVAQGYDAYIYELTLRNTKWAPLVASIKCPVKLIVGEHNHSYTAKLHTAYANENPEFMLDIVENAAHLALYQRPDYIFSSVSDML